MKLIALLLTLGMLAVSGCSKKGPTFSPELVSKAESGDARAQNDLGRCYYKGFGVAQDYNEAVKWYTKSAEQGNAGAQSKLGLCYYRGCGVAKDEKEAVKWFTKAAEQGNEGAKKALEKLKSK